LFGKKYIVSVGIKISSRIFFYCWIKKINQDILYQSYTHEL
jgi:hypothetical protein